MRNEIIEDDASAEIRAVIDARERKNGQTMSEQRIEVTYEKRRPWTATAPPGSFVMLLRWTFPGEGVHTVTLPSWQSALTYAKELLEREDDRFDYTLQSIRDLGEVVE